MPQELRTMEARRLQPDLALFVFPKEESKGRKKSRVVYLTDTAFAIAQRLVDAHPTGAIFRNNRGKPWTADGTGCRFYRLAKKLGRRYALYDFRHSFAHRMLLSGMDSMTLSELMGHKDLTMLKKVYGNLDK